MDWHDLISKVIIGLVTGSIAAYLTARYALGRYYKEKWWDKRIDLYTQLVDCVYLLKNTADYWYKHELHHASQFPTYFSYKSKEENEILREGANKQVISSQADSLIKISRIWADFFPANTSNQPI